MEIDIKEEKERFSSFLAEERNTNIIFSGIFGIGKTYFIHKFFHNHNNYTPIYITPVQYSVSSNEDIFEYIKVDILFELMNAGVNLEKTNFSFSACTQMYIMENIDRLVVSFFKKAEKLKYGTDIIPSFFKLKNKLEKYKNDLNTDQNKEALSFLSINKEKIGSIYEDNATTELIRGLVESLKGEDKQIILVIDDLDRIDPEHIFRILNILSVHENFNGCKEENKFRFDKTIIICDIDNVRRIYSNKYGLDVDFNGYIDKFYSKDIFYFNNIDNILNHISMILKSLNSNKCDELGFSINEHKTYNTAKYILEKLVKKGSINIRTLLKYKNANISNTRRINIPTGRVFAKSYICLIVFDFIRKMFNSIENMEYSIYKLNRYDFCSDECKEIVSSFLFLSEYERNNFKPGEYELSNHLLDDTNTDICNCNKIKYHLLSSNSYGIVEIEDNCLEHLDTAKIIQSAFENYSKYFV